MAMFPRLIPLLLLLPMAFAAEIVSVRKIWDAAPHNAFTDLVRFQGRFYCAFREGSGHVSPDGAIRILVSKDGEKWDSAALLTETGRDLRDPKLAIAPGGRLMVYAGSVVRNGGTHLENRAWFTRDGKGWGEPAAIGEAAFWLWRLAWSGSEAYGAAYSIQEKPGFIRFYRSPDGVRFKPVVDRLIEGGAPSEAGLLFSGDTAYCLVRRDPGNAMLGTARPPYREWTWRDTGARMGGPGLIRLADGKLLAAGRLYDGRVRTSLCEIDASTGRLTEIAALPSGGDTSYPGLALDGDTLWVSYYSSHEGKTAIYIAKVRPR